MTEEEVVIIKNNKYKPFLYVFLAFLQAGLTSGIIFGWPSLQSIFVSEGLYRDQCKKLDKDPCDEQKLFFTSIFTVGTFANNAAPLVTGFFLDSFGPRLTNLISVAIFFLGCSLFVISEAYAKLVGFGLLGFSGPGIYCSIMHLCNLFPKNKSLVLSFFSGTFSVSSFIFKVFQLINEPDSEWLRSGALFIEYIVLLCPFFIVGAFVWPSKAFEAGVASPKPSSRPMRKMDEEQAPLLSASSETEQIVHVKGKKISLYNALPLEQFKSPRYWIPVSWIALKNLHIAFYMGTVNDRFTATANMPDSFNIIWSLGFVAIPIYGVMMDKKGLIFSFFVTSGGLVIFSVLKLIPILDLQYVSFILVSVVNVGIWGIFYSYISEQFGFDNFGKLLGVMSVTVAVVGLLQYPLTTMTLQLFGGNFLYTDLFFVFTSLLAFSTPLYLWDVDRRDRAVTFIERFPVYPINTPGEEE